MKVISFNRNDELHTDKLSKFSILSLKLVGLNHQSPLPVFFFYYLRRFATGKTLTQDMRMEKLSKKFLQFPP